MQWNGVRLGVGKGGNWFKCSKQTQHSLLVELIVEVTEEKI